MDRERIWDKHMQEEGVFLAINLPDFGNEFTVKCKIMLSSLSDFKDSSWALLEILWPPFRKRSMGIGNLADKLDIYHSDNVFSKMSDHEQEIFVFYLSTYFWIFCLFLLGGQVTPGGAQSLHLALQSDHYCKGWRQHKWYWALYTGCRSASQVTYLRTIALPLFSRSYGKYCLCPR